MDDFPELSSSRTTSALDQLQNFQVWACSPLIKYLPSGDSRRLLVGEIFLAKHQASRFQELHPQAPVEPFVGLLKAGRIGLLIAESTEMAERRLQIKRLKRSRKLSQQKAAHLERAVQRLQRNYCWTLANTSYRVLSGFSQWISHAGACLFYGRDTINYSRALRKDLAVTGVIEPLREGDLVTAVERVDRSTINHVDYLGQSVVGTTLAVMGLLTFYGFFLEFTAIITVASSIFAAWRATSASMRYAFPQEGDGSRRFRWIKSLTSSHYHNPLNRRLDRLLRSQNA